MLAAHDSSIQTESTVYQAAEILSHQQNNGTTSKRSFSIEEDSNTCNFTKDSILDESSLSPTRADFSSSLTTDFSNAFSFKRNQICETETKLSFSEAFQPQASENEHQGASSSFEAGSGPGQLQSETCVAWNLGSAQQLGTAQQLGAAQQVHQSEVIEQTKKNSMEWNLPAAQAVKVESVTVALPSAAATKAAPPEASAVSCANLKQVDANDEYPNVAVKASADDKATISISLPTSILKDQKHFQNVIETINNTLLSKHPVTEDEEKVGTSSSKPISSPPSNTSQWPKPATAEKQFHPIESLETNKCEWSKTVPVWIAEPVAAAAPVEQSSSSSPSRKITSLPVSVLSNTRKRNFSSEVVLSPEQEEGVAGAWRGEEAGPGLASPATAEQTCNSPAAGQTTGQQTISDGCTMQIVSPGKIYHHLTLSQQPDISGILL